MFYGIDCHGNGHKTDLENVVCYDLKVSVSIPESWRSNPFIIKQNSYVNSSGHYKDKISSQEGALWNLNTESQRMIELFWDNDAVVKSKKEFKDFLLRRLELSKAIKGGTNE